MVSGFNVLWILCVLLLVIAFFIAIRRRRMAVNRQANRNTNNLASTHQARHAYDQVRIHMAPRNYPMVVITTPPPAVVQQQQAPPAFDPQDTLPPPSYQDFQKDVRIQSPTISH